MSDADDKDLNPPSTPTGDDAPKQWPTNVVIREEDRVGAICSECETSWNVHRRLQGFRFACGDCGAWVKVSPAPEAKTLQIGSTSDLEAWSHEDQGSPGSSVRPISAMPRDSDGRVIMDLPLGRVYEGEVPTGTDLAPGALRHVEVKARQAWTNRTIMEIVAMFLALVAPHAAIYGFLSEKDALRLMPLTSLMGGVLLVLIGMSAPHYTFKGLKLAKPTFFAEAALVCALFVGAAVGWTAWIADALDMGDMIANHWVEQRRLMGLPLLLIVMGLCPALFEELAFRGLLQGRLGALLGRTTGIGVTAGFFALAHGISWASPLHVAIGLYLGFLRDRSDSLLPGMLVHLFYNGSLVLIYTSVS